MSKRTETGQCQSTNFKNMKTKTKWLAMSFVMALFCVPIVQAKTVTMDGTYSDWDDVSALVDEPEFSSNINEYTAHGTTYYFNTDTDAWQTTSLGLASCKANYERMIEINLLKLSNDENYLYGLWERGSDFPVYRYDSSNSNLDSAEYEYFSNDPAPADNPVLPGNTDPPVPNPCAGYILKTPAAFDHDMVISIDKDKNGTWDYYLVINVTFPKDHVYTNYQENEFQATSGYIYQDNGNGEYDGRASETLLTNLGSSSEGEQSFFIAGNLEEHQGMRQEWRMSINSIFSDLGISWGSEVNVRYEAHSENPTDVTEAVSYKFTLGTVKLTAKAKKKVKRSKVLVSGKTTKKASVSIAVNGGNSVSARVARNGKYRVFATLPVIGANTIVVTASHSAKDSKSVTKSVTRKK